MQGVQDIGGQTVVKKKPENVVTVMSCSLKSYFYFALFSRAGLDSLQQVRETIHVVGDGKDIRKNFALRADDEAVVLVLGDIDSNANHSKP